MVSMSTPCARKSRMTWRISSSDSPRPTIRPDLVGMCGWRALKSARGSSEGGSLPPGRACRERALQAPSEIRHEDLDFRPGRALPHRADAVDEMTRAAVLQVVAIHARD